jgi:hypothetical protein
MATTAGRKSSKPAGKPGTVSGYLDQLPADRLDTISRVRRVILDHLPDGYEEMIGWGAITYAIPLRMYPDTYNGQPLCIAAIASQKTHCSLYLMAAYGDAKLLEWLQDQFTKSGKKLNMGKSCVRFKTSDDLPLDVIGEFVAKVPPSAYIKRYEESRIPHR